MRQFEPPVPTPAPKRAAAARPSAAQNGPRRADPTRIATNLAAQRRQAADVPPHRNETGLPDRLKAGVEALSGLSLDDVRVHYGSPKPAQLGAHAYTQGSEIHVAPGQERHLPHEAWHVVQQKQGRVQATQQMKGMGVNTDQALEREADVMGARATASNDGAARELRPAPARGGGIVQRRDDDNPYKADLGAAPTGHHIIPHTLLGKKLDIVTKDDAGKASKLLGKFLPPLSAINVQRLSSANAGSEDKTLVMTYKAAANVAPTTINQNRIDAVHATRNDSAALQLEHGDYTTMLDTLVSARLTIDGRSLADFKARYTKLKEGQVKPTAIELSLLRTFFLWQGGNQFGGPGSGKDAGSRKEPGASDDFDADARYFLGKERADKLLALHGELTEAEDAKSVTKALEKLSAETVGKALPVHAPGNWITLTSAQKDLLPAIEGRDRGAKTGQIIPKPMIDNFKNAALDLDHKAFKAVLDEWKKPKLQRSKDWGEFVPFPALDCRFRVENGALFILFFAGHTRAFDVDANPSIQDWKTEVGGAATLLVGDLRAAVTIAYP